MTEFNTSYYAKIIQDSFHKLQNGKKTRITTIEICYPRFVLSELNTHKILSKNSSSSRAIPVKRTLEDVKLHPVVPIEWGLNKPGMHATEYLAHGSSEEAHAQRVWLKARDACLEAAEELLAIGIHKQTVNRLLEPWKWQKTLITSTEWLNFFRLRTDFDAQPEIREIAERMFVAWTESKPVERTVHLPYVDDVEVADVKLSTASLFQISAARCARISYDNFSGVRDVEKDLKLAEQLWNSGHYSPFEHQATFREECRRSNFTHWSQFRKEIPGEAGPTTFRGYDSVGDKDERET